MVANGLNLACVREKATTALTVRAGGFVIQRQGPRSRLALESVRFRVGAHTRAGRYDLHGPRLGAGSFQRVPGCRPATFQRRSDELPASSAGSSGENRRNAIRYVTKGDCHNRREGHTLGHRPKLHHLPCRSTPGRWLSKDTQPKSGGLGRLPPTGGGLLSVLTEPVDNDLDGHRIANAVVNSLFWKNVVYKPRDKC